MVEDLKRRNVDLGAPVMIDTSNGNAMGKMQLNIAEPKLREPPLSERPKIINELVESQNAAGEYKDVQLDDGVDQAEEQKETGQGATALKIKGP